MSSISVLDVVAVATVLRFDRSGCCGTWPLECAVAAPVHEVPVDDPPGGEIVRQGTTLTAGTGHVQQDITRLCQSGRELLWRAHKLTRQQRLDRFEAEPVADLAMHLRQRPPTPVRPRGKKLAAGAPGGLVLAGLATPAGPGSCTPASRSPRAGGSP